MAMGDFSTLRSGLVASVLPLRFPNKEMGASMKNSRIGRWNASHDVHYAAKGGRQKEIGKNASIK